MNNNSVIDQSLNSGAEIVPEVDSNNDSANVGDSSSDCSFRNGCRDNNAGPDFACPEADNPKAIDPVCPEADSSVCLETQDIKTFSDDMAGSPESSQPQVTGSLCFKLPKTTFSRSSRAISNQGTTPLLIELPRTSPTAGSLKKVATSAGKKKLKRKHLKCDEPVVDLPIVKPFTTIKQSIFYK